MIKFLVVFITSSVVIINAASAQKDYVIVLFEQIRVKWFLQKTARIIFCFNNFRRTPVLIEVLFVIKRTISHSQDQVK